MTATVTNWHSMPQFWWASVAGTLLGAGRGRLLQRGACSAWTAMCIMSNDLVGRF